MRNQNLVLIGFRGCGKRQFGKALAEVLQLPFADLDEEIHYVTGTSIEEYTEEHGWQNFREVEQRVAHDYTRNFAGIVATGVATIENSKNLQNLKKTGKFIFLNPDYSVIRKMLLKDPDFPRMNPNIPLAMEIDQMWQMRKDIYRASGDFEVEPDLNGDLIEEAKKIVAQLPKDVIPFALKQKRIAVFASGNGTTLKGLQAKKELGRIPNVTFGLFVTDNPDAEAIKVAKDLGFERIEVIPAEEGETKEDYDRKLLNILREEQPDQILLAGWMRVLSELYCSQYGTQTFNAHPSLLPKFSGLKDMEVHEKVLDYEEKYSGCTIHKVTAEIDAGEIAVQRKVLVGDVTPEELKAKVQKQEVLGFCELLERK